MLLNFLKLAIRLLIRNPFFSLINVLGLSVGFSAFFALWQYSSAELKTDQHHKDFERIVRIGFRQTWDEPGKSGSLTFGPSRASLPPQFKNDFPEVESYVRISEQGGFFQEDLHEGHGVRMIVAHRHENGEEKIFKETKAAYADRNIFEFFTIPLIYGDPETVLDGVNFVALSESLSEKYFGKENPVGETLFLNDSISLKVTGVFEDFPNNSRLFYDMIISNEGLLTKWSNVYWGGTLNFLKLKSGASFSDFEKKLNSQKEKYWGNELTLCKCDRILFAQPLKEISFSQGFIGDEEVYKSKTILITLSVVSIVILLMAWINYINLSITRLSTRLKEFATRRVNGASAFDLVKQFLTESFLINMLSVGLALTILQMVRRPLETTLAIYIAEIWSTKAEVWVVLALTLLCGIIITGIYPAYVCITRQPGLLFKIKSSNNRSFVTSLLTTAQFTAAIALISWVFIVYLQLNYILKKDIGLDREGVVIVEGPVVKPLHFEQQFVTFIKQLKVVPEIADATSSRYMVGDAGNKPGELRRIGTDIATGADGNGVSEDYIPFFGLKMLAGRNFMMDDRANVIVISRITSRRLEFENPEDALGARVTVKTGNWNIEKEAEIIGVVEDYQQTPYFNYGESNTIVAAEGGFGFFLTYNNRLFPELTPENIAIKINIRNIDGAIDDIELLYKKFFPGNTFEWRFLDDQINSVYGNEKIARNQILMFTLLAIGLACLGLVAMTAQRIFEKTKEVGIRKVLGASIFELSRTLLQSTGVQFLVAVMFGVPLAYYLGDQYLQRYSERIMLTWWHYLLPIVILLAIMFCAVVNMLWKAVRSNPVEALKE